MITELEHRGTKEEMNFERVCMDAEPRIRVLGPVHIQPHPNERNVRPRNSSASQRRLIGLLVANRGSVVSVDRLCEDLRVTPGALRTSISRLRSMLGGDDLITSPPGYALTAEDCDAVQAERMITEAVLFGEELSAKQTVRLITAALSLWRGSALIEFADEEWARTEVARLRELRTHGEELRAQALILGGRAATAIQLLGGLISNQPFRDRPRRLLMEALACDGRTVEALRVFQQYRRVLIEETGAEPGNRTVELERSIAEGRYETPPQRTCMHCHS